MATAVLTIVIVVALLGLTPTTGPRPLQVAVVWSGHELEQFRKVVEDFEASADRQVDVISTGDDIDGFLRARARAGNLPDVAVLPEPRFIQRYVEDEWLQPLDPDDDELSESIGDRYDRFWQDLGRVELKDRSRPLYGAWVKGSFKSWFWYQTDRVAPEDEPQTVSGLISLVRRKAQSDGAPAPMAIGAGNGWVLTDWFENMLLGQGGRGRQAYDALAREEPCWGTHEVRSALAELAELWGIEGAFPGGGRRARLTQFDESVVQLAASDQARMLQGSDFVEAITGGVLEPQVAREELGTFRFPSDHGSPPVLVGGDVAVVFKGSEHGRQLVEWLTRPGSFRPWIESGGYISPLRDAVGGYPTEELRQAAEILRDPTAHDGRFDLANQAAGRVGSQLGPSLERFFADVAIHGSDVDASVAGVIEAQNRAAEPGRCLISEPGG